MGKKKNRGAGDSVPTADAGALKTNPFGALAGLSAPTGPTDPAPAAEATRPAKPHESGSNTGPSRVVLRYQRKGRGGKEVTLVELRGVADDDLEAWLARLKKTLGCGGFLDGDRLAVAGDQRDRLRAYFTARGITRIAVS